MLNLENDLISPKQWGCRPGINQTWQILHLSTALHHSWNFKCFWYKPWSSRVIPWYLKSFDKVWHTGLIFKLCQKGICGNLINIPNDLMTNRKQKVVLNSQCSSWVDVRAGVPQVSNPGPLWNLIYVNDLKANVSYLLMTLLYFP